MAWTFQDFSPSSIAVFPEANDKQDGLTLTILCSPADRRVFQEMAQYAGSYVNYQLALGHSINVDTMGHLNTVLVVSDVPNFVDSGFFAVKSIDDAWNGSVTGAKMTLELARIANTSEALVFTNAAVEYVNHDF